MDEDEEADWEGGGRKMSDHFTFSCRRIPSCKRSATSHIAMKRLPPQNVLVWE